ncbi:MAG: hypothetical protein OXF72_01135 [Gammaproteobacteria bacterium]|nr:hypothetical protein [Gammaproteobacteria bacterium]MCY4276826.1 hypothetical protein [Gammaproteobacteria bacterium]
MAVFLAGCETAPPPEPPPPQPVITEVDVPDIERRVFEPPTGSLLVRIPSRSRSRLPDEARGTVSLQREGFEKTQDVDADASQALFEDIITGRYELTITYMSNGQEVGSYAYPVDIGTSLLDITAPLRFLRGQITVATALTRTFDQEYQGMARIAPAGCISVRQDGAHRAEMDIDIVGDAFEMTLTLIPGEKFNLSGQRIADAQSLRATGRYQSSDGDMGNWTLTELSAASTKSIWLDFEIASERNDCQASIAFTGLVDGEGGAVIGGRLDPQVTVDLVSEGQSFSKPLAGGQSEVVFDDLLIGSYDIFVDVTNDGQLDGAYRDSVVLGDESLRVDAELNFEQPIMGVQAMAAAAGYDALTGQYGGKSMVSEGRPKCTGSIALVDSTKLDWQVQGMEMTLAFDNFYGSVLNLSGRATPVGEEFQATGQYQSSDSKSGTWRIRRLSSSSPGQIAMQVAFENETDRCQAVYEFLGLRE